MQEKLVSVIVPVYNKEEYLRECIDSILSSTYSNIEVIIVNDGSTDDCRTIIDSYDDSRIKAYHTTNGGVSFARNTGIEHASGTHYLFVDADDTIESWLIKRLMDSIDYSDILCYIHFDQNRVSGSFYGADALEPLIREWISSTMPSKFFRSELFDDIRFPEGHIFEDYATMPRLFAAAHEVRFIHMDGGYHYRYVEESLSHTLTLSNLLDYWWAAYHRWEFCQNVVNEELQIECLKHVATAIVRAWGRRTSLGPLHSSESIEWKLMSDFAKEHYPKKVRGKIPLTLRLGLIAAQSTSPFVFLISGGLYKISQLPKSHLIP